MGSTHAGHNPAAEKWPLMPAGGYLRATPRDLLTGSPVSADAVVRRVRVNNPPDRSKPRRSFRLTSDELPQLEYIEDEAPADAEVDDDAE